MHGELIQEKLSERVLGAAFAVHKHLGPGLLESVYEACLCREFEIQGIAFQRQVALPIEYKGVRLDARYRLDLVIENQIVLELKSVEDLLPIHEAQLLTYLRLSGMKIGFLMNFNVAVLKDGVKRRVL